MTADAERAAKASSIAQNMLGNVPKVEHKGEIVSDNVASEDLVAAAHRRLETSSSAAHTYFIQEVYALNTTNCVGAISQRNFMKLGTCFKADDNTSFKVACSGTALTAQTYSTTGCTGTATAAQEYTVNKDTCSDFGDDSDVQFLNYCGTDLLSGVFQAYHGTTDCSGDAAVGSVIDFNKCIHELGQNDYKYFSCKGAKGSAVTANKVAYASMDGSCSGAETKTEAFTDATFKACTTSNFNLNVMGGWPTVGGGTADEINGAPTNLRQQTECVPVPSDTGEVCFAGDETVLLESGEQRQLQHVQVGDRIQVQRGDGQLTFSPVVFLPHAHNKQKTAFVRLEMEGGRSLRATPTHLISAGACGSDWSLQRAEDISVGQCVDTVEGAERVVSVEADEGAGVYSAVAAERNGMLVVNGIKASSFGTNHALVNAYYHLHRALYALLPAWAFSASKTMQTANLLVGSAAGIISR